MQNRQFTSVIEREGNIGVAHCSDVDAAGQGARVEKAQANVIKSVELFLETNSQQEIRGRMRDEVFIARVDVASG